MKKTLIFVLAIATIFTLTACGSKDNHEESSNKNNTTSQETQENVNENTKQQEINNNETEKQQEEIIDDEIIEFDDEDNAPIESSYITVEKVINCDGCVYAYFSAEGDKAKTLGSTISSSEYTTDINNLKTAGGKQRHNFFGLVLSGNTISKAYACILKDNKIYCIQGSTNGAYHTNNIAILNEIFTSDQCKTISAGHTYRCTDGSYNGDTQTTGFTSLHYETSCTIYGSASNTGKLICH